MSEDLVELLFADVIVKKIEIKEISPCTADPERIKFLALADKPLEGRISMISTTARQNQHDLCQGQKRGKTTCRRGQATNKPRHHIPENPWKAKPRNNTSQKGADTRKDIRATPKDKL